MRLTDWNNEVNIYTDTAISGSLTTGPSVKTVNIGSGYTGTAELSCPSPWDWNLNFESTSTNWVWFYLRGCLYAKSFTGRTNNNLQRNNNE